MKVPKAKPSTRNSQDTDLNRKVQHSRTSSSTLSALGTDSTSTRLEPTIPSPPQSIDLMITQGLLHPRTFIALPKAFQITSWQGEEGDNSSAHLMHRRLKSQATQLTTYERAEKDDASGKRTRSWNSVSGHIFSDLSRTSTQDRSEFVGEYNRLAAEHGLAPLLLGNSALTAEEDRKEEDHITFAATPSRSLPKSWLFRKLMRKPSSSQSDSTRPQKSVTRRMSFGDVANLASRRRDSLKDQDLDDVARLSGLSVLVLPPEYAPCNLTVPTCLSATATYLTQHGPSTPGLFRIPGSQAMINTLYDYYGHQYLDAEKEKDLIQQTIGSGMLPQQIPYSVHDVASVFKKLLSGVPGGILGSLELFKTLRDINSHLLTDSDCISKSRVRTRLIALAIASSDLEIRVSLICAVFGLVSMIGQQGEPFKNDVGPDMPPSSPDMMSYQALSVVFGPLLLGNRTEQILMESEISVCGVHKIPETPGKQKKREKRKETSEKKDEREDIFALHLERAKIVVEIAQMLIANWTDVVRQMRDIGIPEECRRGQGVIPLADGFKRSETQSRASFGHSHQSTVDNEIHVKKRRSQSQECSSQASFLNLSNFGETRKRSFSEDISTTLADMQEHGREVSHSQPSPSSSTKGSIVKDTTNPAGPTKRSPPVRKQDNNAMDNLSSDTYRSRPSFQAQLEGPTRPFFPIVQSANGSQNSLQARPIREDSYLSYRSHRRSTTASQISQNRKVTPAEVSVQSDPRKDSEARQGCVETGNLHLISPAKAQHSSSRDATWQSNLIRPSEESTAAGEKRGKFCRNEKGVNRGPKIPDSPDALPGGRREIPSPDDVCDTNKPNTLSNIRRTFEIVQDQPNSGQKINQARSSSKREQRQHVPGNVHRRLNSSPSATSKDITAPEATRRVLDPASPGRLNKTVPSTEPAALGHHSSRKQSKKPLDVYDQSLQNVQELCPKSSGLGNPTLYAEIRRLQWQLDLKIEELTQLRQESAAMRNFKDSGMLSTKHFLSDPAHLVLSSLRSLTQSNPSLALDEENKVVYYNNYNQQKQQQLQQHQQLVSIISGGGSGHEPAFAGFVGHGLLGAAVAGTIFASPGSAQVARAIGTVDRLGGGGGGGGASGREDGREKGKGRGVLVVVMNYTGDVLNFGMAVEKAKAAGLNMGMVVVGDDVGVGRSKGGKVGRRGIAGTVLVVKIAGALAATGAPLEDVHKLAVLTSQNVASVGASLEHVHVPGRAAPDPNSHETVTSGEVEVGMGIHNEPGSRRVKVELVGLVKIMLAQLLDPTDEDRAFLQFSKDDQVVLLVNNLGGVSMLELGGITAEVVGQLKGSWKIEPVRVYSGTYMTSLNGLGFSITLLKVMDTGLGHGKGMLDLLDVPGDAVGWSSAALSHERRATAKSSGGEEQKEGVSEGLLKPSNLKVNHDSAVEALTAGLHRLIDAEPEVTQYDTVAGDGDCGIGLKRGAEAILKMLAEVGPLEDAAVTVSKIAQVVETSMDGTSGALYSIFLNALASSLRLQSNTSTTVVSGKKWGAALQHSMGSLAKYTPAQPGDRTLVDALYPFVETLTESGDVQKAAEAARKGAEGTKDMKASLGRTVYVGGEEWHGVPDPGAYGLSEFLAGFAGL
ncbi:MAG: hypothetical protein M1837_001328 [Sclerophora amabilis]|nr:MAG: hypothetical protein M1837_001328 [Sclerophora amabilis]